MLYIQGDVAKTWPLTVRALAALEPLDMILQHYPSDEPIHFPEPFGPSDVDECIEGATGWGDGERSVSSARLPVSEDLIAQVSALPTENFVADWDLVVVRPGATELTACAVPHEGMTLVFDDSSLERLQAAGLDVQPEPPDWW